MKKKLIIWSLIYAILTVLVEVSYAGLGLSCCNPSLTLKSNSFLLIIFTTEDWLILLHSFINFLRSKNRVIFLKASFVQLNVFRWNVVFSLYFWCLEGNCFMISNGTIFLVPYWHFIRKDTNSLLQDLFSLSKYKNKIARGALW